MRLVLIVLSLVFFSGLAAADCNPDKAKLNGPWGRAEFRVEIADSDELRAKGLMFRAHLPRFSGMLFVYEEPQHARFWMKNTLIPLDLLFLSSSGEILRMHENAIPHDETSIDGGRGVLAVLEINGGLAKKLGITVGSHMQHPAFGEKAVWACG